MRWPRTSTFSSTSRCRERQSTLRLASPLLVGDAPRRGAGRLYLLGSIGGRTLREQSLGAQAYVPGGRRHRPRRQLRLHYCQHLLCPRRGAGLQLLRRFLQLQKLQFQRERDRGAGRGADRHRRRGRSLHPGEGSLDPAFFPTTYTGLWNYFNESYRPWGGRPLLRDGRHIGPLLHGSVPPRPTSKKTIEMSLEEARQVAQTSTIAPRCSR